MIASKRTSVSVCLVVCSFIVATSAFADTRSWTGAVSGLWSVGGNWSGGVPPVSGDDLVFPAGAVSTTPNNDIVGLTVASVSFPSTSTTYTVSGNAITLTGGMTTMCCNPVTWNIPTTLGASQTFDVEGVVTFSNSIALAGHTLSIDLYATTLSGSIGGTGNLALVGSSGGLNVTGSIAIAGNVTMTAATRINVDGSVSAATITVFGGSIVSGDSTLTALTLNGGSILRPGNDPGAGCCGDQHTRAILTTGALTATDATMAFDLVTTTPGSGHDQLAVNGTVTLNTPTLEINYPGAVPGPGSSFVIVANDGADPVSGTFAGLPEGATFTAGSTSLQITYAGGTGNDVVVTVLFGDKAWTGAVNNLWSVGGNWSDGMPPVSGDDLVFPAGAVSTTPNNDIAGLTIGSVSFTSTSTTYNLSGNAITLTGGITTLCCNPVTWNIPITLGASQTFDVEGLVTFGNNIALAGNTLSIDLYTTTLSGSITGTGNIALLGASGSLNVTGSIAIAGNVSLNGATTINVDGSVSATTVTLFGGSIVSGDGTLTATTLNGSAILRPGNDPGAGCCGDQHTRAILTTGNLIASSATMAFDLVTTTPGSGHDQLAVTGTVTLNNPTLQVNFPAGIPPSGSSFVIVANDGTDPVSGTFAGLPEGASFTVGLTSVRITYAGGTGNDVELTILHDTVTTIASSPNPTVSGQTVTLSADVTSTGGIPGGTVSFEEGATVLATATLDGTGHATADVALPAGTHTIVARYLGAGDFAPSESAPLTQIVTQGQTTTTLTTNGNPSIGSGVVAMVHVAPVDPASGVPTGTVTISVDGQIVASGTLDANGDVAIPLPPMTPGNHEIRADYEGDANFLPSFAVVQQLVVDAIPTLSTWMLLLLVAAIAMIGLRVTSS